MKKLEQEPNCSEIPTGSTTKNDSVHNLCDSCTNIGCEFQSGIVRTKCAFYMPQQTEPDNCGNYVVQEPTTKNNLSIYCDRSICLKNEYNNVDCEDCEVTKSQESTTKNNLEVDCVSRQFMYELGATCIATRNEKTGNLIALGTIEELPSVTPQEQRWIPVSEKYEHHIDHTDCIWYGNDSGCPVTCSQYRDGWNDAMDYIFKNGDGYSPYRRNENG